LRQTLTLAKYFIIQTLAAKHYKNISFTYTPGYAGPPKYPFGNSSGKTFGPDAIPIDSYQQHQSTNW